MAARPHQGLGNQRIGETDAPPLVEGPVLCRERLGGLLKSYYREPACWPGAFITDPKVLESLKPKKA